MASGRYSQLDLSRIFRALNSVPEDIDAKPGSGEYRLSRSSDAGPSQRVAGRDDFFDGVPRWTLSFGNNYLDSVSGVPAVTDRYFRSDPEFDYCGIALFKPNNDIILRFPVFRYGQKREPAAAAKPNTLE
ncbi:hypothetical protein ACFYRK_38970 [Streptomyces sp. NPDC005381]|uniref:hypothetical protein n=1 Tax=Streptomyces sp. NPDC005381 TaxID=3364714 RepID=UPI0036CA5844